MYRLQALLFLLVLFGLIRCGEQAAEADSARVVEEKPVVYASNYPLYFFAEQLAGPLIDLRFPAAEVTDPAYWQPIPDTVVAMQQADLILLNGATYEKWLANVTLPESVLVNTTAGLRDLLIELEETVTHSHGPEGEHQHRGTAHTTWLDLSLAAAQAKAVADAMVKALPGQEAYIRERQDQLLGRLGALHEQLQGLDLASADPVVFSHPVYQYFQRAYGLRGGSVHWEPDEAPDHDGWHDLEHVREDHPGARIMIWEAEPLPETVDALREKGMESLVIDPLGHAPDGRDFLEVYAGYSEALGSVVRAGD